MNPTPHADQTRPRIRRLGRVVVVATMVGTILAAIPAARASTAAAAATHGDRFGILPVLATPIDTHVDLTTTADANVPPAVVADLRSYLERSALPFEDAVAPLADAGDDLVATQPTYRETISIGVDEMSVTRNLRYVLAPGVCLDDMRRAALGQLCVTIDDTQPIPGDVAASLAEARQRLATKPTRRVARGVTAADALKMSDVAMLDLLVNGGTRTLRRVSTIPVLGPEGAWEIPNAASGLPARSQAPSGEARSSAPSTRTDQYFTNGPRPVPTQYLLTGFTYEREFADKWEHTWAEAAWWHGKYYVRLDFSVGAEFGVRVPFSIRTDFVDGDAKEARVDLRFDTVNVDEQGRPAYPAVGLNKAAYDHGKEFVLSARVSCELTISIPGPDPSVKLCGGDGFGPDLGRDIDPPLGDERVVLDEFWLGGDDGSLLSVGVPGVATIGLDVGLAAEVTRGEIGFRLKPNPGSSVNRAGKLTRSSTAPLRVKVTKDQPGGELGFAVVDPTYKFHLGALPKIAIEADVDLAIYENHWSTVLDLERARFGVTVPLGRHPGTVDAAHVNLRWGEQAIDQ